MQSILKPIEGEHKRLPFVLLHDSPTQPRTSYPADYITELADSIKANGDILQALLVRKRIVDPSREWCIADGYETIFGHCRKRAGDEAGLPDAPCHIVEMTDEQVRLAQLAENLNRRGLSYIEEAESLYSLRSDFNVSIDELEKLSGKKRRYVYLQLKLAQAIPEVKKACADGLLLQEVANAIARVATQQQANALKEALEIVRQEDGRGYRKITRDLLDKYSLDLKGALWSLGDDQLVPSAGACTTCTKRSGNTPELYGDVVERKDFYATPKSGKDICMDAPCFQAKKKALLDLDARALADQGKTVVTGNAAKQALTAGGDVKGAYVAVKDVKALLKNMKGEDRPKTVLIQDQRTGKAVEAIKKADLAGAGVAMPAAPSKEASQAKSREEQEKWEEAAKTENKARIALFNDLSDAMRDKPRTLFDLRTLAEFVIDELDWERAEYLAMLNGGTDADDLQRLVERATPDDLGILMMQAVMVSGMEADAYNLRHGHAETKAQNLHMLAEHHGINVKAHRAAWEAANGLSTPPTAAQAKKGQQGKPAKSSSAGAGAPLGEVCDRTLPLPLEEPADGGQEQSDDTAQPSAKTGPTLVAAWPFPKPRPSAQIQSDDAGNAGGRSGQGAALTTP